MLQVGLDLAKVLRNLGVLASYEIVQNEPTCGYHYVWPPGKEPADYFELALHKNTYIKLDLRWAGMMRSCTA
jgi:hypothetical protein